MSDLLTDEEKKVVGEAIERRELIIAFVAPIFAAVWSYPARAEDPVEDLIEDAFHFAERLADEAIKRYPQDWR